MALFEMFGDSDEESVGEELLFAPDCAAFPVGCAVTASADRLSACRLLPVWLRQKLQTMSPLLDARILRHLDEEKSVIAWEAGDGLAFSATVHRAFLSGPGGAGTPATTAPMLGGNGGMDAGGGAAAAATAGAARASAVSATSGAPLLNDSETLTLVSALLRDGVAAHRVASSPDRAIRIFTDALLHVPCDVILACNADPAVASLVHRVAHAQTARVLQQQPGAGESTGNSSRRSSEAGAGTGAAAASAAAFLANSQNTTTGTTSSHTSSETTTTATADGSQSPALSQGASWCAQHSHRAAAGPHPGTSSPQQQQAAGAGGASSGGVSFELLEKCSALLVERHTVLLSGNSNFHHAGNSNSAEHEENSGGRDVSKSRLACLTKAASRDAWAACELCPRSKSALVALINCNLLRNRCAEALPPLYTLFSLEPSSARVAMLVASTTLSALVQGSAAACDEHQQQGDNRHAQHRSKRRRSSHHPRHHHHHSSHHHLPQQHPHQHSAPAIACTIGSAGPRVGVHPRASFRSEALLWAESPLLVLRPRADDEEQLAAAARAGPDFSAFAAAVLQQEHQNHHHHQSGQRLPSPKSCPSCDCSFPQTHHPQHPCVFCDMAFCSAACAEAAAASFRDDPLQQATNCHYFLCPARGAWREAVRGALAMANPQQHHHQQHQHQQHQQQQPHLHDHEAQRGGLILCALTIAARKYASIGCQSASSSSPSSPATALLPATSPFAPLCNRVARAMSSFSSVSVCNEDVVSSEMARALRSGTDAVERLGGGVGAAALQHCLDQTITEQCAPAECVAVLRAALPALWGVYGSGSGAGGVDGGATSLASLMSFESFLRFVAFAHSGWRRDAAGCFAFFSVIGLLPLRSVAAGGMASGLRVVDITSPASLLSAQQHHQQQQQQQHHHRDPADNHGDNHCTIINAAALTALALARKAVVVTRTRCKPGDFLVVE